MKANELKWFLVPLLVGVSVWLLWPNKPAISPARAMPAPTDRSASTNPTRPRQQRAIRHSVLVKPSPQRLPDGSFAHVFDKAPHGNRSLVATRHDSKFLPDSGAPSGMDLWLHDESGNDRLINESVFSAKFSPDGSKIAYTTSDCVLHVESLQGGQLAEVSGVYGPNWRPDGTAMVFSKVGDGQNVHQPGTRQLAALDIATGQVKALTDGRFDDGRPEFDPSSDWILFVSGARSGLASFWKVPAAGGEPVQLTNVGLQQINEMFVPTPYQKTIWSADKRWFVYDFKSGDRQETWGLEFNADGTVKQASKLADGINPRWQNDGATFVCEKHVDGTVQAIVSNLP